VRKPTESEDEIGKQLHGKSTLKVDCTSRNSKYTFCREETRTKKEKKGKEETLYNGARKGRSSEFLLKRGRLMEKRSPLWRGAKRITAIEARTRK